MARGSPLFLRTWLFKREFFVTSFSALPIHAKALPVMLTTAMSPGELPTSCLQSYLHPSQELHSAPPRSVFDFGVRFRQETATRQRGGPGPELPPLKSLGEAGDPPR